MSPLPYTPPFFPLPPHFLARRLADGLSDYAPFTPAPANGPAGAYQFTPLAPKDGNQT